MRGHNEKKVRDLVISVKRAFNAAVAVAKEMHRNPPDDWVRDVGGLLKAHGWQRTLQLAGVIENQTSSATYRAARKSDIKSYISRC